MQTRTSQANSDALPARADALFRRWRESRDLASLAELFDLVGPDLLRIALAATADAADAEDAVQETFLAAMESAGGHDGDRGVVPWLVGVLQHKVGDARRARARKPDAGRLSRREPGDPAELAARSEADDRVHAAIDALPEPCRQVALLRWRHGLEPAEIAHLRGERPGAVRVMLHRALGRLRRHARQSSLLALTPGLGRLPRGIDAVRSAVLSAAASGARRTSYVAAGIVAAAVVVAVCVVLAISGDGGAAGAGGPGAEVARRSPAPRAAAPGTDANPVVAPLPGPPVERAVSGRVIDETGAAVRGARVTLYPLTQAAPGTDPARVELSSAADGSFAHEAADDASLVAEADGFEPAVIGRVRVGVPVEIRLSRGAPVAGRVRGDDGKPLAGARVEVITYMWPGVRRTWGATTDATGFYRIDGAIVARAEPITGLRSNMPELVTYCRVAADGWATLVAPLPAEFARGPLDGPLPGDVILSRGEDLEVTVLDGESGAPLPGAAVFVSALGRKIGVSRRGDDELIWDSAAWADVARAEAGTGGRCVLAHVAMSRTWPPAVRAWMEGYTAEVAPVRPESARTPVTLRLWPSAVLRGRVLDASGAPVEGASVAIEHNPAGWFAARTGDAWATETRAGADGGYELRGVRGGRSAPPEVLVVASPPFGRVAGRRSYPSPSGARMTVRAPAGTVTTVPDARLAPPREAPLTRVTFVDEDGAPVAFAPVRCEGSLLPTVVETAADGTLDVPWSLDPGLVGPRAGPGGSVRPRWIVCEAPGHVRTRADVDPAAPTARVVVPRGVLLDVTVRGPTGAPAPWIVVVAKEPGAPADGPTYGRNTDAAGRVSLLVPRGRTYNVSVWAGEPAGPPLAMKEGVSPEAGAAEIVLPAGSESQLFEPFAIAMIDAVDDVAGTPILGAWCPLPAGPNRGVRISAAVIPTGRVTVQVPAGRRGLWVAADGWVPARIEYEVAAGEFTHRVVRLKRGTTIRATLDGVAVEESGTSLAAGGRLALVHVSADGSDAPPVADFHAILDGDGAAEIEHLLPGRYRATVVRRGGGQPAWMTRGTFVVPETPVPVAVSVPVAPVGRVRVRVTDPAAHDGQGEVADESKFARIDVLDSDGTPTVGAGNVVQCRGIDAEYPAPAGRVRVVCSLSGRGTRTREVDVPAGGVVAVEFGE